MGDESGTFEVGYRKPPSEHRFQKGQSGYPKGRPKGSKNKPQALNPSQQPTDSLVLEEAYRLVTIREGETVIQLPAVQAAVRSRAILAMKGSRLAQRDLAELVRQVEDRKAREHLSLFENALDYKLKWTEEIKRRRRLEIDEPDPIPHPDDVIIDFRTGEVSNRGPIDEREKAEWDKRIARCAEAQDEVNYFAAKHGASRSQKNTDMWLSEWLFEQRIFDIINDSMPERYKMKLENRSYHPDASRDGTTLKEFAEDRKKPKATRKWGEYVDD
jgi:hypothetical protein